MTIEDDIAFLERVPMLALLGRHRNVAAWINGHSHKNKIVPLLEAERLAKAAVKKAYDLAKEEGIPKKEIEIAIALKLRALLIK